MSVKAILIDNQCERCGHQPLSDLRFAIQMLALGTLVIAVVSPLMTYGVLAWGVGGYSVRGLYLNRTSGEPAVIARNHLHVANLVLMALVSALAFGSGLDSFGSRDTIPAASLVFGFLAWPAGYAAPVMGLLVWAGGYIWAKRRYTSAQAIEKIREKQREVEEARRAQEEEQRQAEERSKQESEELERLTAEKSKQASEELERLTAEREALLSLPFAWEPQQIQAATISPLSEGTTHNAEDLVRNYAATNHEFWQTFHMSLKHPESGYGDQTFPTVRRFANHLHRFNLTAELHSLNLFCVLKDEAPLAYAGFTLLTNRRLLVLTADHGWYNIPLHALKTYGIKSSFMEQGLVIEWNNENDLPQRLVLNGTFVVEDSVKRIWDAAPLADAHAKRLLWKTRDVLATDLNDNSVHETLTLLDVHEPGDTEE